jgi:hypothetical protein
MKIDELEDELAQLKVLDENHKCIIGAFEIDLQQTKKSLIEADSKVKIFDSTLKYQALELSRAKEKISRKCKDISDRERVMEREHKDTQLLQKKCDKLEHEIC